MFFFRLNYNHTRTPSAAAHTHAMASHSREEKRRRTSPNIYNIVYIGACILIAGTLRPPHNKTNKIERKKQLLCLTSSHRANVNETLINGGSLAYAYWTVMNIETNVNRFVFARMRTRRWNISCLIGTHALPLPIYLTIISLTPLFVSSQHPYAHIAALNFSIATIKKNKKKKNMYKCIINRHSATI